MHMRLLTGLALAGGLTVAALSSAQAGETLRFSSFEPPAGFVTKDIMTPWAKEVSEASNGDLFIEMYAGGTLGRSPAAQLKLVEDGVADIAWIIPGYTPGRYADSDVVNLPLLVDTSLNGSLALTHMYEKGLIGDEKGVKVLGIFSTGANGLHTKTPITGPDDVKNLKLRGAGAQQVAVIEALGAVPVSSITGPTAAESIARGVIDGSLSEWNAVDTFKIHKVTSHHTIVPLGSIAVLVVMNQAKYDGLSDTAKAVLDSFSGEAFATRFGEKLDAHMTNVEATLKKDGDRTIRVVEGAELDQWKALLTPVIDAWVAATPKGADLRDALVAEMAALKK
jgi:TRAP-type C4-dicarboxylate transport system substrate-binding protein